MLQQGAGTCCPKQLGINQEPNLRAGEYDEALDAVCSRLSVHTGFKHRCAVARGAWRSAQPEQRCGLRCRDLRRVASVAPHKLLNATFHPRSLL